MSKIKYKWLQDTLEQGKNLFCIEKTSKTIRNGVTNSFSGSKLTLNGTSNEGAFVFQGDAKLIKSGTYTITVFYDGTWNKGSGTTAFNLRNSNQVMLFTREFTGLALPYSQTLNIEEDTELRVEIYANTAGQIFDCNVYVQIEKGSTATTYEPYYGKYINETNSYKTNIYSSEEHAVGIYDGNTIYEINQLLEQTTSAQNFNLPSSMSDLVSLVKVEFVVTPDNGSNYITNMYYSSGTDYFRFFIDMVNKQIKCRCGNGNLSAGTVKWFFRYFYTKS